jgi:outer membrane cobalamin receptor
MTSVDPWRALIPLLLFCQLLALPPLSASEGDSQGDPYDLPPVVVQERRALQEVSHDRAAAGTVITREGFDDPGESLPDLLDEQVGVRVLELGGLGSLATVSIRGSNADQVLVTLDGIPLNSSAGGPVDLSRLPLGNLGRVEIYRGASPLDLGGAAIGGVLALTSRDYRERQVTLGAGVGSHGAREATLFLSEPRERWAVALGLDYSGWEGGFAYHHDNGTRFDEADDAWVTRRNNHFNQVNALAKGRLQLDAEGAWQLRVVDWLFWRGAGVPGLGLYETRESSLDSLENLLALRLEGLALGDGLLDLSLATSLRVARSRFLDPLSELGLQADDSLDETLAPDLSVTASLFPTPWLDLKLRSAYRYEQVEHAVSLGGDLDGDAGQATTAAPSRSSASSHRHSANLAAEAGLRVAALDLLILPSGRLEWLDSAAAPSGSQGSPGPVSRVTETLVDGRLALVNESLPFTSIRLSGGSAHRQPSLFELFGNSGAVVGNPGLAAERSLGAELGLIHAASYLPRPYRLRLEAHAFVSDVEDLIQFVSTSQNVSRAENLDRARLMGLETALRADLFAHLRLSANYSRLHARNRGRLAARSDKALPLRPASRWHIRAELYQGKRAWLEEAALWVDADWTAGNYLDNANLVWLPHRQVFGLGAELRVSPANLRVALAVKNLAAEQSLDLVGHPVPGRLYNFAVRGSF